MIDEVEIKNKMTKVIVTLESRYTTIRAGRANPNILHGVMVDYYGTPTPIQSLATISIPEARVLAIKPFDKSSLKNLEKAIYEANLGLAPTNNGEVIMLTIPELTGETRKEYVKQASQMAEEARIALRNIRQDENNKIKKDEELREDERDMCLEIVQELTDKFNKTVDEKFKEKESELTSI
jgi:ribosome recycling factor